jgi:primosomal protein N' (replication factor Y)
MRGKYVNIAFNLPVDSLFTYSIPDELSENLQIGMRVLAPLGKQKISGVAIEFIESSSLKKILPVTEVLDINPVINDEMIKFCRWVSGYYFCPLGEVIFSSLPKSTLIETKITFSLNSITLPHAPKLTETHVKIIKALKNKVLTVKQLEKKLNSKSIRSALHTLLEKGIIKQEYTTAQAKVKPKIEKFISFEMLDDFSGFSASMLDNFFKESGIKPKKQAELLRFLIKNRIKEISISELLKKSRSTLSAVKSLANKELFAIVEKEVSRKIEAEFSEEEKITELNSDQLSVLKEINDTLYKNEFKAFLLFGVTGSGKTQVYIEAIKKVIEVNRTAIVLVPEISLTPQLIQRFKSHFGEIVGVIHSRLSEGQRFDVFRGILSGNLKIIIGARSALFAPLKNIGIIIVDEEHDHSYKQSEKNPKYNARDSAVIRARLNNAAVLLGSATPSLESFYNARTGKYKLLELPHRALKTKPPEVEIIDMLEELKSSSKFIKYETPEKRFFSSKLIARINEALEKNQSIILLQNRRGYSAYLECQNCGNVKMCPNCDITLIYHKVKNHLRCHYCGYTVHLPDKCEKCSSTEILLKGTGTEKVEEEIIRLFPKARVNRMDADTVRRKDSHRKILKSFHDGYFNVLVGTQMISKGLDFPNVYLVGVISADVGLLNPDFRSTERTFQLLMQVSGRPGRKSDHGIVIIQTMHADNHIFPMVCMHDYISFYEKEIGFRKSFNYPPFSRMCLIEVSGKESTRVTTIASKIFLFLRRHNNSKSIEIMKPAPALIYKLKNQYRYHIIIKSIKPEISGAEQNVIATETLLKNLERYISDSKLKHSERISIEIDPLDFM